MKEICIDARLIHAFGIGTFLKNLLEGLSKDPRLSFIFLHYPKDRAFLMRYTPKLLIPCKSAVFTVKEQLELPRKIPKCDLFWAPHFNIPLLPIRAKRRLTTIHDTYHLAHLSSLSLPQKLYAKLFYNSACFLSHTITTVSEFSKEELRKYCASSPQSLRVIYPSVANYFAPFRESSAIREKYGLPNQFLLTVGNGKPHKNLSRLLAALPSSVNLVIVGKKEGLREKENVLVTGYVPDSDLPALYSAATAYIFPSLYEGFGFPAVEAMACGCPLIAAESGSLPEVCQEAAEYVNPLDILSVQRGIERVYYSQKRQEELRVEGFSVVRRYSEERAVKAYLEVLLD